MKSTFRLLALAVLGLGALIQVRAADDDDAPLAPPPAAKIEPAAKSPIITGLETLFGEIKAKIAAADGKITAAQLGGDLERFDAIIAKYPGAKPEEKAGVLWMKAMLFIQVFEDYDQGAAIVRRFKTEYPTTEFAAKADEVLASIEKDRKAQELRKSLVAGATFPGVEGKSLDGSAVSTAALKGKVVLVDFWATWCPPCREEIPNVVAAYEKFHAKGFDVLAVSLDQDEAELKKFIAENKMPWVQIFEGADAIAEKFGIESIPTTYLIDADGKIVATDLHGDALAKKLEELLGGKK
jgi:thiol-disulfide isomerase/thioredoxin